MGKSKNLAKEIIQKIIESTNKPFENVLVTRVDQFAIVDIPFQLNFNEFQK